MEILIAKRTHSNAAAFVKVENNVATVYGKFYDGTRGYPGPVADVKIPVPEELRVEIEVVGSWRGEKSGELTAFCDDCFKKAAIDDSWFKMFVE